MTTTDPTRIAGLLFGWGVGGIATLIGLTGVTVMVWNIKQNRESESWPQGHGDDYCFEDRIEYHSQFAQRLEQDEQE